jgi:two-component system, cell cycle sensor histidine kinase and response regulator CckA
MGSGRHEGEGGRRPCLAQAVESAGDRQGWILVGIAAVWVVSLTLAATQLAHTLAAGRPTAWWASAISLAATTVLYLWCSARPQDRSTGAAHLTAAVATLVLLAPVAYGQAATIWWLPLVGLAGVLLGRRAEAWLWGSAITALVVAAVLFEQLAPMPGVRVAPPPGEDIAKIAFSLIVIGLALAFRTAAQRRMPAPRSSDSTSERQGAGDALPRSPGEAEERVQERTEELTRLKESVEEDAEMFRALMETAPSAVFVYQGEKLRYANPATERISGFAREELLELDFWELVHPDYRELIRERGLARQRGEDVPGRYEFKIVRKDGETRWVDFTASLVRFRGGPAALATAFDVTEEHRLREVQSALYRLSEAAQAATSLDEFFRSIHVIIGRLMDARNFYVALYDAPRQMLSFPYFVDEVDQPPAPRPLGRGLTEYVLRTGRPTLSTPETFANLCGSGEVELVGSPSVDWLGVPLKVDDAIIGVLVVQGYSGTARYSEDDKRVLGHVSTQVAQAITRKGAEEALRESQKMQVIGQLAGGVAHDFNNLLQALLGSIEVLRIRSSDPETLSHALAEIEEDVRRGAALTRQLLLFSRRDVVKVEGLDLNEIVRQASTLLRRLLRENVQLSLELAGEPLRIQADRSQLEQVLVNLVVNATDAMAEGGRLTIRSGRAGDEAFIEVEDTGSGMTDEVRAHIFEPFFTTKGKDKGVGLGLSVVHGIITQHGGRVEVASRPGHGSSFRIFLPGVASSPATDADVRSSTVHEARPGRGERVLVVEDEQGARQAVGDILRLLRYDVVTVASGEEALALEPDRPFDLLLTDVLLPGIHGSEVATRLQARWPELHVILMSGYAESDALHALLRNSPVRFLQKPFGMATLAAEIRAALERS